MITLSHPDLDDVVLDDWDTGLNVSGFDLGHPETRSVVTSRPSANGADDETEWFGARVVSLNIDIFDGDTYTMTQNLDRVKAFMRPGLRPTLSYADPATGVERAMTVRPESMSSPIENGSVLEAQIQFVAPSGVITGASDNEEALSATSAVPGITFDVTFDLAFPAFTASPGAVTNAGNVPADWRALVYGPCTGPTIENRTTGELIYLEGLVIATGDYVEIDTASGTILVNSDPDASRYSSFDFATSTWWQLAPGESEVAFYADTVADPSSATFVWRDTWL
jgi:hypothetical protein